jgi:hypothetical protein
VVSRKVAKYAKIAKLAEQRHAYSFATLRAFATLREPFRFFHTFSAFPQSERQSRSSSLLVHLNRTNRFQRLPGVIIVGIELQRNF